ncbi:hypothetical protein DFH06DRAFT_623873 [Mycena polygramma]|nr:hypothetical protein DFH06DRAFT_623873 [Mycena polygramma]
MNMESNTAAPVALSLPEIVDWVFCCFDVDEDGDDWDARHAKLADLSRSGRVNKLWYHEAMRHLWRDGSVTHWSCPTLPELFAPIARARRQFYAGLIECCILDVLFDTADAAVAIDAALQGLDFSRLSEVRMRATGWSYRNRPHVPRLEKNRVRHLKVDPRYEACNPEVFGVSEEEWDDILDQIPTVFPDLRIFEFEDCALVKQSTLKRFARRLPHLRELNYSLVRTDLGQYKTPYILSWQPQLRQEDVDA